jgi:heme/copper-type cytochrome/quinol oxidase subunit 2
MDQDTTQYNSTENRPLPKWLTDQRDGLNQYQPEIKVMKEDNSLNVSFMITGAVILIVVFFMTVLVMRKKRNS